MAIVFNLNGMDMDYTLYIFSDSFNSLFVTHTVLDILFVLIVHFADIDIEYYSIERFIRPFSHSCICFSFSVSILFV
jgi:hypothetical protein